MVANLETADQQDLRLDEVRDAMEAAVDILLDQGEAGHDKAVGILRNAITALRATQDTIHGLFFPSEAGPAAQTATVTSESPKASVEAAGERVANDLQTVFSLHPEVKRSLGDALSHVYTELNHQMEGKGMDCISDTVAFVQNWGKKRTGRKSG